jgi:hypothetical protein
MFEGHEGHDWVVGDAGPARSNRRDHPVRGSLAIEGCTMIVIVAVLGLLAVL